VTGRRRAPRGPSRHAKLVVLAAAAVLAGACVASGPGTGAPSAEAGSSPAAAASPGASSVASPEAYGEATSPTPVPTPSPGTGRIVDVTDGFAITLPSGWRQVPVDGSSIAAILALLPSGSSIPAVLRTEVAQAEASGIVFLAIDLRPATLASGNASTVNVNVQAPSTLPLPLLEPLVTGLLSSAPGITNIAATQVTLPAGKAIRITYTQALATSVGTVKLAGTQFVLLSSKHTYTVSFGCTYADAPSCRSQADAMMKTFDLM
jgi:hypothetical protein